MPFIFLTSLLTGLIWNQIIEWNQTICNYIFQNWIKSCKSQRLFALEHNIEESIVRKIKNTALKNSDVNYNIPVITLARICEAKNLKLSEFFKLVEQYI